MSQTGFLKLSPNLTGAFFMAIAMAAFTFNDAIIKLFSENLPIPQLIYLRGFAVTLIIGVVVLATNLRTKLNTLREPLVWWRSLMEVGATFSFLTALKYVPLGNAAAILSALPLAVTLGSALFLNEDVGWRRWLAILTGFFGVLVIVRPGFEGFNIYSLLIVVCVVFAAARDLFSKKMPAEVPSMMVSAATSLLIFLTAAIYTLLFVEFVPVEGYQYLGLVAAAALITIAYFFIVAAMRIGEVSFVTPFRYTSLIWAIGLGYLIFNDKPDLMTFIGASIIVCTGIYTLYREQKRRAEEENI